MRNTFIQVLTRHVEKDPRILLITGDLGFGVLTDFARQYPRQYLNVGVAEQNMASIAAGLALEGRTIITYSIGNFPTLRCLEQIRNDICYHKANVKIVAIGGGMSYGELGITHHATEDIAVMRSLPGMTVYVPGDMWETEHITREMLAGAGPCYLRLDKSAAPATAKAGEVFAAGHLRSIRQGKDVTLVAAGGILAEALTAASRLEAIGVSVAVLSAHTIKPLDAEVLQECLVGGGGLVTIEEHGLDGGLGSAIAEYCLDHGILPRWFLRLGLRNEFSSVIGTQSYQRASYGLDADAIAKAVIEKLPRSQIRVA